jgi:hypothetical protein
MLEYDPQPPFSAGTPPAAGPDVTRLVTGVLQNSGESVDRMVETAKKVSLAQRITV